MGRCSSCTLAPAIALALAVSGCVGAGRCAAGRACGVATWLDESAVTDGRMALAPLTDAAGPGARGDTLSVSSRAVLLRFDLAPLAEAAQVDRAVLALSPSQAWRPSGATESLVARAILGAWTARSVADGVQPAVDAAPAGTVALPANVRGPVRVDVTALVRSWVAGALPVEGIALESTGTGAVFLGAGCATQSDRARLEVVYR